VGSVTVKAVKRSPVLLVVPIGQGTRRKFLKLASAREDVGPRRKRPGTQTNGPGIDGREVSLLKMRICNHQKEKWAACFPVVRRRGGAWD